MTEAGPKRVAVLGAGAMGTAMAALMARVVPEVSLWARDASVATAMARGRCNQRHLPGADLPPNVEPTADPDEAAAGADLIVAAIPSAFLRRTLEGLAGSIPAGVPALSVVKGIEAETFARPSRILVEVLGPRPVAVLSGPSHAEEIVRGLPASVVVAGTDDALCRGVQRALNSESFRVYTNPDADGVELAGALKNVLGVAAGICDGLGFGDNAKAALVTRGLVEIARFAVALGARRETFWGLAGVGDVVATCYSPHGRNRAVGEQVGRGRPLADVLASMASVAEGVFTARSVHALARSKGIEMPITDEVHGILYGGKAPREAVAALMVRGPKDEWP